MTLEHAVLQVKPGRSAEFESAFRRAKSIISDMVGFRRLSLSRCLERPDTYLLLVEWDSLKDHVEGFRKSPQYEQWRSSLHDFYDPFPMVEHYEQVEIA
ncbi:antibiotic biosynthesis monooxygenase family protein [Rhodococcus sp. NPDC058514]|uniref:antibiotic biosynthesis monooxygenase family protein n=1 Tax=unclassified Rhodococcus (in: high G+C Gram-positive bacteria) TaxID=192944 RepID=UPI003666B76F